MFLDEKTETKVSVLKLSYQKKIKCESDLASFFFFDLASRSNDQFTGNMVRYRNAISKNLDFQDQWISSNK